MSDEEYTAKLFKNGGSQAVRLPKALQFPGTEVRVRRVGNGVLIEPVAHEGWGDFWEQLAKLPPLPDDFDVGPPGPPEPHRDAVIDEWVAEMNAQAEQRAAEQAARARDRHGA